MISWSFPSDVQYPANFNPGVIPKVEHLSSVGWSMQGLPSQGKTRQRLTTFQDSVLGARNAKCTGIPWIEEGGMYARWTKIVDVIKIGHILIGKPIEAILLLDKENYRHAGE